MALVLTVALSAQSVGTAANVGNSLFPTKVTLNAATITVALEIKLVNGAIQTKIDQRHRVRVYSAVTAESVTAANAPELLKYSCECTELIPPMDALDTKYKMSKPWKATGGFFCFWVDVPAFPLAGALTVNVIELSA
jgi:hypothetical protein